MGGYLNRVIQMDFPDLAGTERPDDHPDGPGRSIIWLTIRNPKLVPGGELIGEAVNVRRDAEGGVIIDQAAADAAYGGYVKLIIAGHILDPTDPFDENPPALPMPPTALDLAKYPIEVLNKLAEVVSAAAPR